MKDSRIVAFLFVTLCQFNVGSKIIIPQTLQSQHFIGSISEIWHGEFTKSISVELFKKTIIISNNNHD